MPLRGHQKPPEWNFLALFWILILLHSGICEEDEDYQYRTSNTTHLNKLTPGGPNVCRSKYGTFCCPGWSRHNTLELCIIPICTRPCGGGNQCIRPNICRCSNGSESVNCHGPHSQNPLNLGNPTEGIGKPCRAICMNGGTCVDGKCQCSVGFVGEFCTEPVCLDLCKNDGRCIGPNKCACIYGFGGNHCEIDYRTGPCYMGIRSNLCINQLQGVVCTKILCCATVGKAWGHPCEHCPSHLECEIGFFKNQRTGECIDINECEAIPHLCEGGHCVNSIGSFSCECPEGQARDPSTNRCGDKNECEDENICPDGRCVNTDGSYYCLCNPGFIQSQNQKYCIDGRQGLCFTERTLQGFCHNNLPMKLSKKDCCCGVNMGQGWGDECYKCPTYGEFEHRILCATSIGVLGSHDLTEGSTVPPGFISINECILRPDICGPGQCIDTAEGYECVCNVGFRKGKTQVCEDINECHEGKCQNGKCHNVPGSFTCTCPPGFDVSPDGTICTDHNECEEIGMCTNGICINMDGSFKCQCKSGFKLSPSMFACIDIDECYENPRICLNGRCDNTPGSYTCDCLPGFTVSHDKTFCSDMDECASTGMCDHGKCINVEGSFRCICDSGYRLGSDSKHCIDIDECINRPCQSGSCANTPGSFHCDCPSGFTLGPDGRSCLDTRRDLCYQEYHDGVCLNPSTLAVTRSSCCCCSIFLGKSMGWGSTQCQPCPTPGTSEFDNLCPHGPGSTFDGNDINECAQNPNICPNGACENMIGTYRCICNPGFKADEAGKACSDINECEEEEMVCSGGKCRNTPGSYQCICPTGTQYNSVNSICEDVNECKELGPEACFNGECINVFGSYRCECDPGFMLDNTGRVCLDNRKSSCWTKLNHGKCENDLPILSKRVDCCCSIGVAWGSPCERCNRNECECPPGFSKSDGKTCIDINECDLYPDICRGGGTCVNTDGSFTCSCPPGLTLDSTKTQCLDIREEQCYAKYQLGKCTGVIEGLYRKNLCCCTTLSRAWGDRCEPCPRPGTPAFHELCPKGLGFIDLHDINECTEFPSMCENGRCQNTIGGYSCKCNKGYDYDDNQIKCIDIDECSLTTANVCGNGICKNVPGDFQCICNEGFRTMAPLQICIDINECDENFGLCRGGTCINTKGSFKCQCPPGHELSVDNQSCKDIDECSISSGICSNGICENMMGTYQCVCNEGYKQTEFQTHCEDIDECEEELCEDVCINLPGSFRCSCGLGFSLTTNGRDCVNINECKEIPRVCNGSQCQDTEGSFTCHCGSGFNPGPGGTSCIDINECTQNSDICGNGECYNVLGSFFCRCEDGYSRKLDGGPSCTDDDECFLGTHECDENADCINIPGSYQCRCFDGFTGNGKSCRDINECKTNNGGCDQNAQCINNDGSFKCECDSGYRGDGYNCVDVDECTNDPSLCDNGQCINYPGSFKCECEMGFMHPQEGNDQSCIDIDECQMFNNLCVFGKCENLFGVFRCECHDGYKLDGTGGNCTDIDECESPQSCLYGKCINLEGSFKCICPENHELTSAGNACIDRRISRCFLHVDRTNGCSLPTADYVTKASCCCSIGQAWGPQCELCPLHNSDEYQELCPGGPGYQPNITTVVLQDINECIEHENICLDGYCTNTFGSFMCSCNEGFKLDETGYICIDINECEENLNICNIGQCVNEPGKYYCQCPEGYMPLPGRKECVDMRKDICFLNYSRWQCSTPMTQNQTKKVCCCSMGQAWGQPCESCPIPGTREHSGLCGPKPGQIMNPMTNRTEGINECELMPTMCNHGQCIDTPTSFECQCYRGYIYDLNSHQCIDDNECIRLPCSGNAQCINLPGSFECKCPEGYKHGATFMDCIDINECIERPNICQNGECKNLQGSFQCVCDTGYLLTSSRDSCIDIDECLRHPNICSNNGSCVNMDGHYKCHCQAGFKLSQNLECIDVDECYMMPFLCRNGRCKNTLGSFICECASGYTLSPDGHNCHDIDECHEVSGTCPPPGKCINVMGSFICECPAGYELSAVTNSCEDIDECEVNPGSCANGVCQNTLGGAFCTCPDGFKIDHNLMTCVDMRQEQCYEVYSRGQCLEPRGMHISLKECCCSKGAAWSKSCQKCPMEDSNEFHNLCPEGPGRLDTGKDINECELMPSICEDGTCINTDGSFRCECPKGYVLDNTGKRCIDENECLTNSNICGNGTCSNVVGGFECRCNAGFAPGPFQVCEDVNECFEIGNQCAFRCHNIPGSFRCICPYGYALAADGRHCEDVNECYTPANNCKFQCKNLIGSFMCICPQGYTQIPNSDDCRDINECASDPTLCQNGRCINTEGSYHCECFAGFEPTLDRHKCIDHRKEFCFSKLVQGQCNTFSRDLRRVTKSDCCCSMGQAWGPNCELCPSKYSPQYQELCLDSGFTVDGKDVDECKIMPDLCRHGGCINTMGSYRCSCNKGYKVSDSGLHCLDIDECEHHPSPCEFSCQNVDGSYTCSCPSGYRLNYDGISCVDIDECETDNHVCLQTCTNTKGSYNCSCFDGYTQVNDECHDIDECKSGDVCPRPGRCINTLGSFKCICPRGFKVDPSGSYCIDSDECLDDSKCPEGCQNLIGGYKCGCGQGYVPHIYYNQCVDDNECLNNPCGDSGNCFNTPGSYRCGCPNGYQFDSKLNICVQVSAGCYNAPCNYGCTKLGSGFSCGCPGGYQRIEQGHCFSSISSPIAGSIDDIGDVPVYSIEGNKKLITTEGCFSCKINGRKRRNSKFYDSFGTNFTNIVESIFKVSPNKLQRHKRHFHKEDLQIKINLDQTKHRTRLIKLQPSVKVEMNYLILSGNENHKFELTEKHGVWSLHFRKRLKIPESFLVVIYGKPTKYLEDKIESEIYAKPLTLKLKIIVTES